MGANEEDQRRALLIEAGLVALFIAGLVLASSYLVAYPAAVLSGAWVTALIAMAAVLILAFRQDRATGKGVLATIGQSLEVLGRFVFAFF